MKKIALLFSLVFTLFACSNPLTNQSGNFPASSAPSFSSSQPAVEMLFAKTTGTSLEVFAEVENLAYAKKVTLFYSVGGQPWTTADGIYVKSLGGNRELWKVVTPSFSSIYGDTAQFAVRYEAAGKTWWDNNQGNDYRFPIHQSYFEGNNWSFLGKHNVLLHSVFTQPGYGLSGYVLVKNLAYQKAVKVVWSQDNWKTVYEAPGVFAQLQGTTQEYWKFEDSRLQAGVPYQLAVSCTVNGQTFWDNNFGANYSGE